MRKDGDVGRDGGFIRAGGVDRRDRGGCGFKVGRDSCGRKGCVRLDRHVDDGGGARVGDALPVDVGWQTAVGAVAGDVLEAPLMLPVGERDAYPARGALGGADARLLLHRNSGVPATSYLLTT